MTNDEYFQNIYRIKNQIQKLDDDYFDQDNWQDPVITEEYEAARELLCKELEDAYNVDN